MHKTSVYSSPTRHWVCLSWSQLLSFVIEASVYGADCSRNCPESARVISESRSNAFLLLAAKRLHYEGWVYWYASLFSNPETLTWLNSVFFNAPSQYSVQGIFLELFWVVLKICVSFAVYSKQPGKTRLLTKESPHREGFHCVSFLSNRCVCVVILRSFQVQMSVARAMWIVRSL